MEYQTPPNTPIQENRTDLLPSPPRLIRPTFRIIRSSSPPGGGDSNYNNISRLLLFYDIYNYNTSGPPGGE